MNSLLERNWLVTGFGLLALLMGVSTVVSHQNTLQLVESNKQSQRTHEVIRELNEVASLMTIAESGRRGFIYLDNRQELKRYQAVIDQIPLKMQLLRFALQSSEGSHLQPHDAQKLNELDRLVNQRLALLKQSIQLHQPKQSEIIIQEIITLRSIALRDRIEVLIKDLQQQQQERLDLSVTSLQKSIRDRRIIEFWLVFSGFAILLLCFLALHHQLRRQQHAEALQQRLAQDKELSDLKLRFFSMVSHEFRTPLTIILGSAQLLTLGQDAWNEPRKLKNVQRIQSSAKVMTQLLSDMLTLTRAEAGKLECNPAILDLEAFCLNLIEDFESLESVTHALVFRSDCPVAHGYLDEQLLYSTLSNLMSNAIKYSPPESKVQLRLRCTDESIVFQVEDEGSGISLDDQRNLFEPFYRGSNSISSAGTGLGLAVVKRCVELQRGTIKIDSQEKKGTTFTVTFPKKSL